MTKILDFWFTNKKSWFCQNLEKRLIIDKEITDLFLNNLINIQSTYLHIENIHDSLEKIIVLDQFTRHIYRDSPNKIKENTEKAVEIVDIYLKNYKNQIWNLDPEYLCFFIMPLRHSHRTKEAFDISTEFKSRLDSKMNTLNNFIKASEIRLPILKEIRLPILKEDFVEFSEIDTCVEAIKDHEITKVISKFISGNVSEKLLVVSLSGGVDSMVILRTLAYLDLNVQAVHINYGNRPESKNGKESQFLQKYCDSLGVPLTIKILDYHRPNSKTRSDYEAKARNDRFELYKSFNPSFVFLGHHKGDIYENMLTNMFGRRTTLLDLDGMTKTCIINGVPIARPLLCLEKDVIYDFSHKVGVPYFIDSTPKWSVRGKMRDILLPALEQTFGRFKPSLIKLSQQSKDANNIIKDIVDKSYEKAVNLEQCGERSIDVTKLPDHRPILFWNLLLKKIVRSLNKSEIKEKSLKHIENTIRIDKKTKITFNPDIILEISKTKIRFV